MENSQILEHIGKTKTQKLIHEITHEYLERKNKKYPPIENPLNTACLVSVVEEKEIKSIGMSCINDLLNNNFALFIKGAFLNGGTQTEMLDVANVITEVRFTGASATRYNNNQASNFSPVGSYVQVGQGTTPALIDNFAIETPFSNGGIEDSRRGTGIGAYFAGLNDVLVSSVISPTIGGGSISEAGLFAQWRRSLFANQFRVFLLSRDNISPVVPFSAGNTINIDYTINMG